MRLSWCARDLRRSEGLTSGLGALCPGLGDSLVKMSHARCTTLPRERLIAPRGCGTGRWRSASASVRLWTPNRFLSRLLVLAQDVGAKGHAVAWLWLFVGWGPWCCGRAPEPRAMAADLLRLVLLTSRVPSREGDPRSTEPSLLHQRVCTSVPSGYSPRVICRVSRGFI